MKASDGTPTPSTIDEYINAQPGKVKDLLQKIRRTISETAPEATEVISYKMPAYKYHGMLVYFAAFKDHCSLFPGSKSVITKLAEELKTFEVSKGTIRFTIEHPLPLTLIKKIVKIRMKENLEKQMAKTSALGPKLNL
jgi:uncharacterized protein YdhG (YjbR/CyaY superfamily)